MAHVLLDRAKVVATSMSGTGDNYTLTNAPPAGFVDFTGVGDGNTTFYVAEDDTGLFEIGIGTFATSGEVLSRTDGNVILSSNVGNNNRVSWPSNSTPTVFISQPADKAVSLDNADDLTLIGANANAVWDKSADLFRVNDNGYIALGSSSDLYLIHQSSDNNSYIVNATGDLYITNGADDKDIIIRSDNDSNGVAEYIVADGSEGEVKLYHADSGSSSVKLTTKSTGIDVTGNLTVTSTENDGPVINLVSNDPSDAANWANEGTISFKAENDASEEIEYAKIMVTTADIADGAETGRLKLNLTNGGGSPQASYQFASNKLFLENDNHAIRWNNTKGTNYDLELVTTTPTANRTYTLPDADGTVITTGNADAGATTSSSGDADHVLIDDGGVLKKITPANLGIGGGITTGKAIAMAMVFG